MKARGGRVFQNYFQNANVVHKTDFPPVETKRNDLDRYPELDVNMAKSFLYVMNFSKRDYQFDISLACVKSNTLVVIPTGLGKTFIAAVIILNFYRWFPKGKIIFLATSRPLVSQQFASIRDITQIDSSDIVQLTGSIDPKVRENLWKTKRVIFATPQTVQNDIERGVCPASQVVLTIIDEAHHATGDHSYCKVVSGIAAYTQQFRVVGLSATPGNEKDNIQDIIYGLMITRIEYRTDDEYKEYTKTRDVEYIITPMAKGVDELVSRLNTIAKRYLVVLQKENLVPHTDPTRMTKGQIALFMKNQDLHEFAVPMKAALKLFQFREYLQNYSISIFVNEIKEMMKDPAKDNDLAADLMPLLSAAEKQPQDDPKMKKLCELVVDFLETSDKSRIIIFCNFRKIVHDIVQALSDASPIVKCSEFVGQAKTNTTNGLNQKKQISLIESFRKGIYNVLVSTAIGEEGLDIGEVDLIICFDMQKSNTRTIQRMGRTGRKRDGKVIFLLTESQKSLVSESDHATSNVCNILRTKMNEFTFYKGDNEMNPFDLEIVERAIDARDEIEEENADKKKKASNIKRKTLTNDEISELQSRHGAELKYRPLSLSNNMSFQTICTDLTKVTHSFESHILSEIVESIFEMKIRSQDEETLFAAESSTTSNEQSIENSSSPPILPNVSTPSSQIFKSQSRFSSKPASRAQSRKPSQSIDVDDDEEEEPKKEKHDKSFLEIVTGIKIPSDSSSSSDDDFLFLTPLKKKESQLPSSQREKQNKTNDLFELNQPSKKEESEQIPDKNFSSRNEPTTVEDTSYRNEPVALKDTSSRKEPLATEDNSSRKELTLNKNVSSRNEPITIEESDESDKEEIKIEESDDSDKEEEIKVLLEKKEKPADSHGLRIYTEEELQELSHLDENNQTDDDFDFLSESESFEMDSEDTLLVDMDPIPRSMFDAPSESDETISDEDEKTKKKVTFIDSTSTDSSYDSPPEKEEEANTQFIESDSSEEEAAAPVPLVELLGFKNKLKERPPPKDSDSDFSFDISD